MFDLSKPNGMVMAEAVGMLDGTPQGGDITPVLWVMGVLAVVVVVGVIAAGIADRWM